jgi:hypothetical protein
VDCRSEAASVERLMINVKSIVFFVLMLGTALSVSAAEQRLDLQGATIVGDRELPKVLYIVPWRSPFESDVKDAAPVSLAAPEFLPLDRDEFRRTLDYQGAVRTNRSWRGVAR